MGFEKKRKNAIPSATYTTHQAGQSNPIQTILKLSRNKKDLNDVTAALFLVSFSQLPAAKNTGNGTAMMSLRSFLFRDDFRDKKIHPLCQIGLKRQFKNS